MKPLIIVFLAAISLFAALPAGAQSVAEAARQERARQAQAPATKNVYSNETTKDLDPIMPVVIKPADSATAKPGAPVASASAGPDVKQADLLKEYNEQLQALRTKVQALQDQETAAQLQINDYSNQFFAPITNATAQLEAQNKVTETKTRLAETRSELTATRTALQKLEAQGPPAAPVAAKK